ncbi:sulfatase [bacterium]|nr:sulfatase [bacterium]
MARRLSPARAFGAGFAAGLAVWAIELAGAYLAAEPGSFFIVRKHAGYAALFAADIAALVALFVPLPSVAARAAMAAMTLFAAQFAIFGARLALENGYETHANPVSIAVAAFAGALGIGGFFLVRRVADRAHAPIVFAAPFVLAAALAAVLPRSFTDDAVFDRLARAESSESAAPAAKPPAGAPNVLLVVVDTLRVDAIGAYGNNKARTPNIDALAARGVLFRDVTSVSSWTRPVMASILTGLRPREHKVNALTGTMDAAHWTIAERARNAGFATIGVVTNPILKSHFGFGHGFAVFDDTTQATDAAWFMSGYPVARAMGLAPRGKTTRKINDAERAVNRLLRAVDARGDAPYFAWLHLMDPHAPYELHEDLTVLPKNAPMLRFFYQYDDRDRDLLRKVPLAKALYRSLYDGEVAYTDRAIGRLFAELKARHDLSNTVVVFTSDHGEQFLEHDGLLHGYSLYQEEVRVPLIVAGPGIEPAVVDAPRSNIGLAKLLLALAGIENADRDPAALMTPDDPVYSEVDAVLHDIEVHLSAARMGDWKAIRDLGDRKEIGGGTIAGLFDLANDPGERKNWMMANPDRLAEFERLFNDFDARYRRARDAGKPLDPRQAEALRSLGYLH